METEVLVVLGSPNSPTGELSDISKSRLDCCRSLFTKGQRVLCTGGWGAHFNTSDKPHAFYTKEYLLENGLSEEDFLEFALSKNTVDDAVQIKPILSNLENVKLSIISSDYHLERVKLIFNTILENYPIEFIGAKSKLSQEELRNLAYHEEQAIQSIKENGLYY